jgi:hypothetical protein
MNYRFHFICVQQWDTSSPPPQIKGTPWKKASQVIHVQLQELLAARVYFFFKYTINVDTYISTSIHSYEYTHAQSTSMNISKRLSQLNLEIHEVSYQECFTADRDVTSY